MSIISTSVQGLLKEESSFAIGSWTTIINEQFAYQSRFTKNHIMNGQNIRYTKLTSNTRIINGNYSNDSWREASTNFFFYVRSGTVINSIIFIGLWDSDNCKTSCVNERIVCLLLVSVLRILGRYNFLRDENMVDRSSTMISQGAR